MPSCGGEEKTFLTALSFVKPSLQESARSWWWQLCLDPCPVTSFVLLFQSFALMNSLVPRIAAALFLGPSCDLAEDAFCLHSIIKGTYTSIYKCINI